MVRDLRAGMILGIKQSRIKRLASRHQVKNDAAVPTAGDTSRFPIEQTGSRAHEISARPAVVSVVLVVKPNQII